MWHRKIQYQLNEQDVLETLTNTQLEEENSTQHHCVIEAYNFSVKKNCCTCFTTLSIMHNDLLKEFENCPIDVE